MAARRESYLRKEFHDSGLEDKISFDLYKKFVIGKLYPLASMAEKLHYELKKEVGALMEHENYEDILNYIEEEHPMLYRVLFGCESDADEYGDESDDDDEDEDEESNSTATPEPTQDGGRRKDRRGRSRRQTAKRQRHRSTRKKRYTK
jgi:hypothetical protein